MPVQLSDRRRGARTRDEVLDAAARVFALCGFHGATMKQVATELGLTPGALYSYFDSKESLYIAANDRLRDRFLYAIEAASPQGLSFAQQVELILLRLFELADRHRAELAMFLEARPLDGAAADGGRPRGFHMLRRHIERWLEQPERAAALACAPQLAANAFASIVVGLIRVRVSDADAQPLVPQAPQVRDLLLGGIATAREGNS